MTCWTAGYKLTFTWGFISWISSTYKRSDPNHWTSQVLKGKVFSKFLITQLEGEAGKKKRKSKKPNTHYSSTMAFVLFLTLQRALNHLLYYNPTEKPVFLSTSKGNQRVFFKKQIWHQTQDNTKLSSTKLQFPRIEKSQCFFRSNFFTAQLLYQRCKTTSPCPSLRI